MKTDTFQGTIRTAFGQALPTPIEYSGTVELFESADELRESKEGWPSDKEIVTFVNNRNAANARSSATAEALDKAGVKKPELKDSVDLQVKTLVKVYMAAGKSEAEATKIARGSLGLD